MEAWSTPSGRPAGRSSDAAGGTSVSAARNGRVNRIHLKARLSEQRAGLQRAGRVVERILVSMVVCGGCGMNGTSKEQLLIICQSTCGNQRAAAETATLAPASDPGEAAVTGSFLGVIAMDSCRHAGTTQFTALPRHVQMTIVLDALAEDVQAFWTLSCVNKRIAEIAEQASDPQPS